jgi:hypothetical protein
MFNYQTDYYRSVLMSLVSKGLVQKQDKGFALTPEGMRVTKEYPLTVLESGQKASSPSPDTTKHSLGHWRASVAALTSTGIRRRRCS